MTYLNAVNIGIMNMLNNWKLPFIFVKLCLVSNLLLAQQNINWKAQIVSADNGSYLPFVQIRVLQTGQKAMSDEEGNIQLTDLHLGDSVLFWLPSLEDYIHVVSENNPSTVPMKDLKSLQTATITGRRISSQFDKLSGSQIININKGELRKAACCNLSESFETTPSIDVAYSDGMTGLKQIQLLGLETYNILITLENIPYIRGISAVNGLNEIPGTWISSMQLGKGVGSVVNGYEGNAGQINIELKKPMDEKGTSLNFYQSRFGRTEINADHLASINDKLYVGILGHYSNRWMKLDENNDGFMDMPTGQNLSLANKWQYYNNQLGLESQLNLFYSSSLSNYGAIKDSQNIWKGDMDLNKMGAQWKIGKFFDNQPWKSIGLQLSYVYTDQTNSFHTNKYSGKENWAYMNLIYQSIIGNVKNVIKTGFNMFADPSTESLYNLQNYTFTKMEKNIGIFGEYSYLPNPDFTLVLGLRGDINSLMGPFITPRLHIRKTVADHTFKFQIGRASKMNNILSENLGLINSTRVWSFNNTMQEPNSFYGVAPEVNWNVGLQYLTKIKIKESTINLSMDYNHTWFISGFVINRENYQYIGIYSLPGKFYSDIAQVQLDYEINKHWNTRIAGRYNHVVLNYTNVDPLIKKPFIPDFKAFLNVEYHNRGWTWNNTLSLTGHQRIPSIPYQNNQVVNDQSPLYLVYNIQINKEMGKHFDWYFGWENIGSKLQTNPVITNPGALTYVDASMIWGPINRNMIYVGMNWKWKK